MLRWRCQYFYWIPLSERCKIDLKIILIRWAEHLFWIYSKYVQVGQNWNVGLKPQQMCHTPSLMDINRSMLEVIFTHPSSHILSPHLIGSIITWSIFFSTRGKSSKRIFYFRPRVFSAKLTNVDFGQRMVKLNPTLVKILISAVRIFFHKNRGWSLTFGLTDVVVLEGCVTLLADRIETLIVEASFWLS